MTSVMLPVSGSLQAMLIEAHSMSGVSKELSEKAKELSCQEKMSFRDAQEICCAVRSARDGEGPWLHQLMPGSKILLPTPPERVKSKELQERLKRLRKEQEDRQYKSMVADITVEEREAELLTDPGVKGFKESVGFGLNVIVTSYVFYLLFNECGKRLASDPGMQKMFGIFGMFLCIIMHVSILMIRSSYSDGSLGRRRRAALAKRNIGSSVAPGNSAEAAAAEGVAASGVDAGRNVAEESNTPATDPQAKKTQ